MPEVNFSELINKPKDTVDKLNRSRQHALRLRRRDAEDLVLTTGTHADRMERFHTATTRMYSALMASDAGVRILVTEVIPVAFPWVRFLPAESVRSFVVDLVRTAEAALALNLPDAVDQLILEWRSTAAIYADPELKGALSRPSDEDAGPVPMPLAADGGA